MTLNTYGRAISRRIRLRPLSSPLTHVPAVRGTGSSTDQPHAVAGDAVQPSGSQEIKVKCEHSVLWGGAVVGVRRRWRWYALEITIMLYACTYARIKYALFIQRSMQMVVISVDVGTRRKTRVEHTQKNTRTYVHLRPPGSLVRTILLR